MDDLVECQVLFLSPELTIEPCCIEHSLEVNRVVVSIPGGDELPGRLDDLDRSLPATRASTSCRPSAKGVDYLIDICQIERIHRSVSVAYRAW